MDNLNKVDVIVLGIGYNGGKVKKSSIKADQFKHIDVKGAQALIEQGEARLVDIRDPQSFAVAHSKITYITNDTI